MKRRLSMTNRPKGYIVSNARGHVMVFTLRIEIFARTGERIASERGGLDLASRLDVEAGQPETRPDALEDPANIAEGIGVALAPFVEALR